MSEAKPKPEPLLEKLETIACRLERVAGELTARVAELRREAHTHGGEPTTLHRAAQQPGPPPTS